MIDSSVRARQALEKVPWMAVCGSWVLDRLATDARVEFVADRTMVAWRGRALDSLVVVVAGTLEISMSSAQGRRHVTNWLGPGQVFGLISVLDGGLSIHDASVNGAGEIVRVARAHVLGAMREFPVFSEQVVQLLCSRARKRYDTLAAQSLMSFPVRLARVLVDQMNEAGTSVLTVPQADLADMLGVARQSLNVELRHMERAGVLHLGRNRIEILDWEKLERLCASSG